MIIYKYLFYKKGIVIAIILSLLVGCWGIDDSPLKDADGNNLGVPGFASGPTYGNYYPFAEGIIDAAEQTLGMFIENISTNGSLENAVMITNDSNYLGEAYMGLVQEDVFRYTKEIIEKQYDADPATVNKSYLKISSQLKVLLVTATETVHLLVNDASGITSVSDIYSAHIVNIGPLNSGTYITAKTTLDAHGMSYTAANDDPSVGIQKVINGTYAAAFFVTSTGSPVFKNISATAPVELVQVQMPASKKLYNENGTIMATDYSFQDSDVSNNVTVKTLLVAGPNFDDSKVYLFLDYMFDHADEYKELHHKWEDISLASSQSYMRTNPHKCNYSAISYVSGFPKIDSFYIEPNFCTENGVSAYHDMYNELDFLMTFNLGIGLKEKNTTGTWENAYRILNGEAAMALVQDDIFSYLSENNDMFDSMMIATMKKVVPLHYEYAHLLVNTNNFSALGEGWNQWYTDADTWGGSGAGSQEYPCNMKDIFTDPAIENHSQPVLHINVGPKTSGTFISAMEIIDSYRTLETGAPTTEGMSDLPDMESMEIHYHFDEPSDAVLKVESGEYHAAFVMTGVPYERFHSHDSWDIATELEDCVLIPAQFYDPEDNGAADNTPDPYREGTLDGGGTAIYENYPYTWDIAVNTILENDITTVRVRAVQVVSAAFDNYDLSTYIKSVFRKSYYMTYPNDSGEDFLPDPLWVAVKKESVTSANADYLTYQEDIIGAKEYFLRNPYGWTREAAKYYLSMFSDN